MKKLYTVLFTLLLISTSSIAQTYGQLNVSVSTSEAGGNYNPKNIVAIWVEDMDGQFVKTLLAYANNQKTHLNTWQASTNNAGTEYNTTDAVTGATRTSHGTRQCIWNGLDYNQNLMIDGTYKLWMELTDKNGTGNYSSFEFTKGEDPQSQTPSDVPSFSDIAISWEPSGTGVVENNNSRYFSLNYQARLNQYTINGPTFDQVEVMSISGQTIFTTSSKTINLNNQQKGIYLLKISFGTKTEIHKVLR